MTESRAAGPRGAGSAAGAGLLQTLARQPGPVPAAALARDLGLPRSTTYHLLAGADRRRFRGAPAGGAPLRAGGDRLRDRQRVSPAGATGTAGPAGARAAGRRIALVTPALEVRHGDERLDGAVPRSGSAERRTPRSMTVGFLPSCLPRRARRRGRKVPTPVRASAVDIAEAILIAEVPAVVHAAALAAMRWSAASAAMARPTNRGVSEARSAGRGRLGRASSRR
jgi:hypothetical protein